MKKICLLLVLNLCWLSVQSSGIEVSAQEAQSFRDSESLPDDDKSKTVKIAIIGAGIGGSSSAYFLNELLKSNLKSGYEIHIFEKNSRVGGRLATVEIDGNNYEAGGSIIHERNKYAQYFARKFGLGKRQDFLEEQKTCIINKTEEVFCQSDHEYLDIIKGAWRYGFDLLSMKKQVHKILDDFERIYQTQKDGIAFDNVLDLLYSMNPEFINYTKNHYSSLTKTQGYREHFINEILQSITLVNYGQSANIPAFVGFVSFAGAGAQLWSVEGGNKRLPELLLAASGAKLHKQTNVQSVTALPNGQYKLEFSQNPSQEDTFDAVILAFPMTVQSSIQLVNVNHDLKYTPNNYNMHLTKATFVKGIPLPKYDNYSFFSCNENNFVTSVGEILPVDEKKGKTAPRKERIYKIFSGKDLDTEDLKNLFSKVEVVESIDWLAYPEYSLNYHLPSFRIADGLFYLNAIEWAASAMEMSLIGGKNVALLTCNRLGACDTLTKSNTPRSDL